MKSIVSSFRRNFLAGLLVTVPFGLTLLILFKLGKWIIGFVSAAPAKVLIKSLSELPPSLFQTITFGVGFLGTIIIVLLAGIVARNFIGRKLLGFGEGLISRIPLARTIYTGSKQIIETVFGEGLRDVKRVVMFEYPRKGIYSIGFVTGILQEIEPGKKLLGVFLPTAFNPTGGFYFLIPEDEVKELPISVEDAFRIIVSGGLASEQIEGFKSNQENYKKI